MSKTRVAPLRKITLLCLELMAAVITARLCTYVKGAIDCPINRIVCWTDNSSTLHWIRGAASQWKPFVANRVFEIQSLLDRSVWRYCPGPQNPAELPTQGLQCSSDMFKPKYTRNTRQPNTRIHVCIYAYTRIQYMRVCLFCMYELTYCFFYSYQVIVSCHRARKGFHYF